MKKTEFIEHIAEKSGLSKADSSRALDAIIATVTEALQKNEQVVLTGFGTFLVRGREARTGRNPRTGETMNIAASKAPAFKAGKALKDALN